MVYGFNYCDDLIIFVCFFASPKLLESALLGKRGLFFLFFGGGAVGILVGICWVFILSFFWRVLSFFGRTS
jgi:hypothetical protein